MIWCERALCVPEAELVAVFFVLFYSGQPMTTGESLEPMGPAAAPVE